VGKKVNLPLFTDPAEASSSGPKESTKEKKSAAAAAKARPSIEAARARLGGRVVETDAPPAGFAPGVLVTFALGNGRRMPGVIVFASHVEVHVLLDSIRLRRLPPVDLTPLLDAQTGKPTVAIPIDLEKIAGDARLFGQLVEGESVRYADDGGALVDGKVVEKCRWGALVLRDDGAVIAVGFRKLWPSPANAGASGSA
jgi:hypothetical protein